MDSNNSNSAKRFFEQLAGKKVLDQSLSKPVNQAAIDPATLIAAGRFIAQVWKQQPQAMASMSPADFAKRFRQAATAAAKAAIVPA